MDQSTDNGRYMALDLGEKRIGVALTDSLRIVAHAHDVFPRTSRRADFEVIGRIAAAYDVRLIVVGLPLLLSGEEGAMATWARDYGRDLSRTLGIPVAFWDETFTSVEAENSLREYGFSRKKMKGKIDAVAAALILRSYLEAERERRADGEESA